MNGRLVLVVGPSGAGKDTLIALARDLTRDDPGIVFPRRVVTRPSSSYEEHDTLPEGDFLRALEAGAYALAWQAHGLHYGVPVSVEADLAAGRRVVCNVSRTILGEARTKYGQTRVVLVTAPAEVLAARLAGRTRASDGAVTARLGRSAAIDGGFHRDAVIRNVGLPESGARELLRAIREL